MKDKTLNEINYIKNGTITKIKNVKKYMIDKSELEFNNVKNKAINDIDNVGDEFKKSGSEFESTFKKVGYEILDGVISAGDTAKQNILSTSQTIQDGLPNTGENIENNIVSSLTGFKDKMITDFSNACSIMDSSSPIEDGLKSIFTEMSNSLLFLLQSQQQKSSIMDYLS